MAQNERTVRVFISSTFRDMKEERQELHNHIFPQLHAFCEARGLTFTVIDPCWGAEAEDTENLTSLSLRLEEIERCRPFFIGILGERYGWVPGEIPQDLIEREPWLEEHRGKSVTELEFLHGALNNPATATRAIFYFRDPAYVESVAAEERGDFVEEDPVSRQKVAALKDRVRRSGLALREDYRDPETLGERVLADLTASINQEFPSEATLPEKAERPKEPSDLGPAKDRKAGHVFISYAHEDGPVVDALHTALEKRGARCWLAPRDVLPGPSFADQIIDAVERSRVLLVAMSPHSSRSESVRYEVEYAMSHGIPVAVLRIGDLCKLTSLTVRLAPKVTFELRLPLREEDVERVARAVHDIAGMGRGDSEVKSPKPDIAMAGVPVRGTAMPMPPDEPAAVPPSEEATPYLDENVQFTVYRPGTVRPQQWYPMLAFAHLSERPPDAPEDEPDPVQEVRRQAQQLLGTQLEQYQDMTQDSRQAVPREGELTFVPEMPGIEFNPPRRTFLWQESVHREEFRLRASPDMDGRTVRGRLSVFLGSIILAEVTLSIRVDSGFRAESRTPATEVARAPAYRKIFASYSHRDAPIVEQFEGFAKALGDRYLRDCIDLRAGEVWDRRLAGMIDQADIFQLFWSSNSMYSPFVKHEWEHALSLRRSNFVRPTYWEEPLPEDRAKGLPPEELRRLHFQRLGGMWGGRPAAERPSQSGSSKRPVHQVTCPHCWHVFPPEDVCYIARHPDLLGDPVAGAYEYLRFRPTRFNVNGEALDDRDMPTTDLACPRCHRQIPEAVLELPPVSIAIVGTPASGQSYFMTSMVWELRSLMPRFSLSLESADPVANNVIHEQESRLFVNPDPDSPTEIPRTMGDDPHLHRMAVVQGTEAMGPAPLQFTIARTPEPPEAPDAPRIGNNVRIYDNVGEGLLPGAEAPWTMQRLVKSDVIFMVFDPTQDPGVLAELHGDDPQLVHGPRPGEGLHHGPSPQVTLLREGAARIRRHLGITPDKQTSKPVIVIVTKFDLCTDLVDVSLDTEPYTTAGEGASLKVDMERIERTSDKVRECFRRLCPEFVCAVESLSQNVCYVPVSSLGCSPVLIETDGAPKYGVRPKDLRPRWVTVPLLYALCKWAKRPVVGITRA